jgi:ATP-binding cassette subfamily B protein
MRYKLRFAAVFLNMFATISNAVLTPLMMGLAISKLANPQAVSLSFQAMFTFIGIWSVIGIIANQISLRALSRLEVAVQRNIYLEIADHLMHESYDFHAKNFSGALLNQANRLGQGYVTYMDTLMMGGLRNMVIVLVSSIALAFYDPLFALIMFAMSFTGITTTMLMTRKRYPLRRSAVAALTKQSAYLADMIANAVTVKSFAAESYEQKALDQHLKTTVHKTNLSWQKQVTGNGVMTTLAVLTNVVILAYGIYATQHGLIPLGAFIAAQLYAVRITGSFWDLMQVARTLENVFGDADEMTEILQQRPNVLDSPQATKLSIGDAHISFDRVMFRYPDASNDDTVLDDFTLHIAPGERVGLVGRSGGGKTTITKLLLRFMDIQTGAITIDGQDIREVTQDSLRAAIAYVPQEPLLFHRTLADNIRYGNPQASDEAVRAAAKLAHADDFIDRLLQGYETEVGERGVKLSGGQRQRIAIARAMLKNAPVLVLDEATSALDSESEALIQDALWKLMEGKTAIVIAHRLSTIQHMDRIIVLDEGKIVEQGTHKQLLKNNHTYAKLWNRQSGGFIEE